MIFRGFSHRTFTLINRTAVLLLSLFLSVVSLNAQTEAPRGFHPGKSYALSDIESISMSSGNMSLNIPLASLPAGRGSAPGSTLTLLYNSKLFDSYPEIYSDPLNPGLPYN
ncbi:MAG TPA: hypothetical protein VEF04_18920, partial [Blastocatellia bacterium]|nr:hypothetical protein [Blastocatellia bacterium]